MVMVPSGVLAPCGDQAATTELRAQYEAYRVRHARRLLRMLPRESVRPLYRRSHEETVELEAGGESDPLARLVAYCERILPLPPFEVWLEDLTLHPIEHLRDLDDSADVPTARAPVTVEARQFDCGAHPWLARLRSFRDDDAWRGFISFEDRRSGAVHRTTLIFRESDPAELRDRFLSFEDEALEAFLRSALP